MTRLPPSLTDRPALERNRLRAARHGLADFLLADCADELEERLTEVNRTFTAPAVVSGFGHFWRERLPRALVVPDDEVIGLQADAHDVVIHALSLHWANDPVGQLVQCRRALRPDGLFLGFLLGGQTLWELRSALAEAEAALTGGLSPRVVPMGEIRDLGALLMRAGFALPVADASTRRVSYASPADLMRDLRAMGEGNALDARLRRPPPRRLFERASDIYARAHGTPDGRIPATFETIWLTGWAPADSQPRPLRPGSASARLAEALQTAEHPLPRDPLARPD